MVTEENQFFVGGKWQEFANIAHLPVVDPASEQVVGQIAAGDGLAELGRRSALERAAYLVAFLYQRAAAVGLIEQRSLLIPITQQHVADTLGLSIVHTNKTLKKLSDQKLIRWHDRACEVLDVRGLMEVAAWTALPEGRRPLI